MAQTPILKTNYSPYQFNKIAEFGDVESKMNEFSGVNVDTLVTKFKLHYAPVRRTLTQKYELMNTSLEDTIVIAVRHSPRVNEDLFVKLDNVQYKIMDISSDDSDMYVTYDLLTVQKVKKRGNANG
ncbi:phage head closure protein [Paucilactobacillus sp. N302-9]